MSVSLKALENTFHWWYVFGESEATCDIADSDGDIFCGVDKRQAKFAIAEHNRVVDALCQVLVLLDQANESAAEEWQAAQRPNWQKKIEHQKV